MKKFLTFAGLTLVAGLTLAACSTKQETTTAPADDKETVLVATVGTTKPFSFELDGELTGYDIEVARAVFEGSDKYQVEFQKTEWSSIFTGLDASKYQIGANNLSYNDERAEKYLYSAPIANNPLVLAVNKDSGITSFDEIGGKSTQVVQGNLTIGLLEDFNAENPDNETSINYTQENITAMLRNVDDGKYDYKIFETQSVKTIVEEQGLENIEIIEIDLTTGGKPYVYFIFAQDQEEVQAFVNERLKELYEDGTLEELSQKFLGGSYLPEAEDMN